MLFLANCGTLFYFVHIESKLRTLEVNLLITQASVLVNPHVLRSQLADNMTAVQVYLDSRSALSRHVDILQNLSWPILRASRR